MSDTRRLDLIDRTDRMRIRITGADRAKFLHNYVTNDIKKLALGSGCEAFVTSPQGKTLGWVSILAAEDHHLLRADPNGLDLVMPHFAKYAVFDDVAFEDEGPSTAEIQVWGHFARPLLVSLAESIPSQYLDHVRTTIGPIPDVRVIYESTSPPGMFEISEPIDRYTLILARDRVEAVVDAISTVASTRRIAPGGPGWDEVEWDRISRGLPVFGHDIGSENLPQEVGRNDRAISFVKGCYLGQETVARIDALGHVNKLLKSLRVTSGGVPEHGDTLSFQGSTAGTITSAAPGPCGANPAALAMVRQKHAAVGTVLTWTSDNGASGEAVVTEFP